MGTVYVIQESNSGDVLGVITADGVTLKRFIENTKKKAENIYETNKVSVKAERKGTLILVTLTVNGGKHIERYSLSPMVVDKLA